jgi:hypothetical protein
MINKYNWKLEIKRDIDTQLKNATYSKNKSIKTESNNQQSNNQQSNNQQSNNQQVKIKKK